MLKAFSSSVLSFLLIVTLMWGGCISCPQFFMFPKAEKSCCNKTGQCKRPVTSTPVPAEGTPLKECRQMPLETHGFASVHVELQAALFATEALSAVPVLSDGFTEFPRETVEVASSPPDLNILNSIFLI